MLLNRDEVFDHLTKKIECRPIIAGNMSAQLFWKKKRKTQKFPNAEKIHDYGLYLPNHANLKKKDIIYICKEFSKKAKLMKNFKNEN